MKKSSLIIILFLFLSSLTIKAQTHVDLENNEQIRWKDINGGWRVQIFPMSNTFFVTAMGSGMHLHLGDGTSSSSDTWFSNDLNTTPGGAVPFIIKATNQIGVGTSSPVGKFDINPGGWGNYAKISFDQTSDHPSMRLYRPTGSTNPKKAYPWWIENSSQGKLIFKSGSPAEIGLETVTPKITILSNGQVGIGVDNPDSKLVVDGKIRSEEVKVEVINGPDYVFEPDYQLRTLRETKEYIAENKHLPEIPSAKEMESGGVDLGDMNMRLLKKIEELTLYQIELMEEMEAMKKELQELKNK